MTNNELNEWMALNVGGWTKHRDKMRDANKPYTYADVEFGTPGVCLWTRGQEEVVGCPNYCGDGNLMLEVMDWLFDDGGMARVEILKLKTWDSERRTFQWLLSPKRSGMAPRSKPGTAAELPGLLCRLVYSLLAENIADVAEADEAMKRFDERLPLDEAHEKGWLADD